jgi:excisionase family DNA binding protein
VSTGKDLDQEFLSIDQLAELLQVSRRTVESWNLRHTGPTITRIGKHVRYRREDVEDWLGQHRGGEK